MTKRIHCLIIAYIDTIWRTFQLVGFLITVSVQSDNVKLNGPSGLITFISLVVLLLVFTIQLTAALCLLNGTHKDKLAEKAKRLCKFWFVANILFLCLDSVAVIYFLIMSSLNFIMYIALLMPPVLHIVALLVVSEFIFELKQSVIAHSAGSGIPMESQFTKKISPSL